MSPHALTVAALVCAFALAAWLTLRFPQLAPRSLADVAARLLVGLGIAALPIPPAPLAAFVAGIVILFAVCLVALWTIVWAQGLMASGGLR